MIPQVEELYRLVYLTCSHGEKLLRSDSAYLSVLRLWLYGLSSGRHPIYL